MAITFPYADTQAVSTTEYSLTESTTTTVPKAQTEDGDVMLTLDLNDLGVGEILTIQPYEKSDAGTQRKLPALTIVGPPPELVMSFGPWTMREGWDITAILAAGSVNLGWRLDNVAGAGGGSSTYYDREATQLAVEVGDVGSYLVFEAKDTANAAVAGKVAEDWTVKFQRAGASSATAMTTPTVTEQDAGDIPGVYKLLLDEGTTTITDGVLEEIVTYYLTCTGVQPITRHIRLTRPDVSYRRFTSPGGGGANTLVLDAGASATNDIYRGNIVEIIAGTGKNQIRTIIGYDGASKTATLNQVWATNPDNTSVIRQYAGEVPISTDDIVTEIDAARPSVNPGTKFARGTAVTDFTFPMQTTAGANATGVTVTFKISLDGGAFVAIAGTVTEISDGWYTVDNITAAEMDGDIVAFNASATGCVDFKLVMRTQL